MPRNAMHVHTVVKLLPHSYAHTASCHHIVVRHTNLVLRTMLTKDEFREFKKELRSRYGKSIRLRHGWRPRARHITVRYTPSHFTGENTLTEFEESLYFLLMRGCTRSHLAIVDRRMAHC